MNNHQLITNYYISHRDELLAFAGSRLHGATEAEDVVQDVFLRLLTSSKMISETTLPALVYTTMRHLITDFYRRCHTFETFEYYLKNTDETANPADSVLNIREINEQLERGLAHVPESCREAYRLHIYGGMKVSEISRHLGKGYKRMEHQLGAARRAVRQTLLRFA